MDAHGRGTGSFPMPSFRVCMAVSTLMLVLAGPVSASAETDKNSKRPAVAVGASVQAIRNPKRLAEGLPGDHGSRLLSPQATAPGAGSGRHQGEVGQARRAGPQESPAGERPSPRRPDPPPLLPLPDPVRSAPSPPYLAHQNLCR